jgi:hypothetical protein
MGLNSGSLFAHCRQKVRYCLGAVERPLQPVESRGESLSEQPDSRPPAMIWTPLVST